MNNEKPESWRLARRPGGFDPDQNGGVVASRRSASERRAAVIASAEHLVRERERRGGLSDAEVAELWQRASTPGGLEGARARALILVAAREILRTRGTASLLTKR